MNSKEPSEYEVDCLIVLDVLVFVTSPTICIFCTCILPMNFFLHRLHLIDNKPYSMLFTSLTGIIICRLVNVNKLT